MGFFLLLLLLLLFPGTVIFGYDLLSMGEYRARKISQFINTLLPYTGYGYYKVISHARCPENFNIPVTSLMGKNRFDIQRSVALNVNLPSLADVVRQMKNDLHARANRNINGGLQGNQVAILFIEPSVTGITSELIKETESLRRQGSKLFVVSVGQKHCCQPKQLRSLAGGPNTFTYPTYKQLLYSIKHTPFRFRAMCNRYTSKRTFL